MPLDPATLSAPAPFQLLPHRPATHRLGIIYGARRRPRARRSSWFRARRRGGAAGPAGSQARRRKNRPVLLLGQFFASMVVEDPAWDWDIPHERTSPHGKLGRFSTQPTRIESSGARRQADSVSRLVDAVNRLEYHPATSVVAKVGSKKCLSRAAIHSPRHAAAAAVGTDGFWGLHGTSRHQRLPKPSGLGGTEPRARGVGPAKSPAARFETRCA